MEDITRPYNIFDLIPKDNLACHEQFRYGFGKKLIMLHGLGSSGRYWAEPSKFLGKNFQVISYDLLGFGESPRPDELEYYLWQQADALRQALWNNRVYGKIYLVGHSLGALVALEFAKRYPRKVGKLVLTNIPIILDQSQSKIIQGRYKDVSDNIKNELHRRVLATTHKYKLVRNKILPRYAKQKLGQKVFSSYDLDHIDHHAYVQSIKNSIQNQRCLEGLEALKIPVFIINTDKDRAVLKANIIRLASLIENANLIELKGTHQFPVLEPKEFSEVVTKCIR